MDNSEKIIDAKKLVKCFGSKTVVNKLSIQVNKGEIYGFLGPNGSGKTTTIRMICGLLNPDGGGGTCLGHNIITESNLIKLQVGYMSQHFSLYEDLSVQENLEFIARLYQINDRKKSVKNILEQMKLNQFSKQLAGNLSGGWKQRLALACCLIHNPKLLLLDEPTAGVDPQARRDFWDEVHNLTAKGITALISTHYMDEAERCTRLAYIAYGHILVSGTAEEIIKNEKLITYTVKGKNLYGLETKLKNLPSITQVVAFGNTLHVSGNDENNFMKSIKPFMKNPYIWEQTETSLEEVFISLMNQVKKN